MPEGPEVETYRARLEPRLVGRTFCSVRIHDHRLTMPLEPAEVEAELKGERVAAVERRGKYLVIRFESGLALVVHLRMTGGFPEEPASHERAVIDLDDGTGLSYRDVRRFGTWHVLPPAELDEYLAARLGPEPLGPRFTVRFLAERLARRRAPLKAVLLDQRVVAGWGTSTPTRRSGMRGSIRCGRPPSSSRRRSPLCAGACAGRSAAASSARARISATARTRRARCRTSSASTGARASRAGAAARRSRRRAWPVRGTHYCPVCQR